MRYLLLELELLIAGALEGCKLLQQQQQQTNIRMTRLSNSKVSSQERDAAATECLADTNAKTVFRELQAHA